MSGGQNYLPNWASASIWSGAFLMLAACGQPSAQELRQFAIDKTGGQFCTPGNAIAVATVDRSDMSVAFVGSKRPSCTAWVGGLTGAAAIAGQISLRSSSKPVVLYANDAALNRSNPVKRVIIRIIGGPGLRIGPKGSEADYIGRSSIPTMMVTLGYSGTGHYSRYPDENFRPAIEEFIQLAELLCSKIPNARFLVIGESLGGPIAVEAIRGTKTCRSKLDALLISPMIVSPRDQLILAEKNFYELTHNKKAVVVGNVNSVGRTETWFAKLSLADSMPTFFSKAEQRVSLYDRLGQAGIEINRFHMLVGDKDRVTGIEENARFAATFRDRTTVIKGMGHGPNPETGQAVAAAVDAAFSL
jgi:pimeloyl-ACP methyl ester carboxylesterase